jgi:uncharacterized membrane protein
MRDRPSPVAVSGKLQRAIVYLKSALWAVPIGAVLLGLIVIRVIYAIDRHVVADITGLGVAGAQTLFQTIITLTLSFVVFTFGSLLVAIQVASGQLTPRIIATTLLRDRVVKYTVGLNMFTMLFAIIGLNRTQEQVMQLVTLTGAMLGIACIATFLFLIDYAARLLRPVRIVALVSNDGMDVIRAVYPDEAADQPRASPAVPDRPQGDPVRVVRQQGR